MGRFDLEIPRAQSTIQVFSGEQPGRLRKTDWPNEAAEDEANLEAQERADATTRAAGQAEAARRPMWRVLRKKQLSLPPNCEEHQADDAAAEAQRAEARRLPHEPAQKLEPWRPTRTTSQSDHPVFRGQ